MARPDEAEFLKRVLKGNMAAVSFCQSVFRISQVWDDLIDRDRPISNSEINEAFWRALIELQENPFYRQNELELKALMRQYISDWFEANELEKGGEHERTIAFVLRDSVGSMVTQCAYLVDGYQWMRSVAVEVRKHIFEDDLKTYLDNLPEVES